MPTQNNSGSGQAGPPRRQSAQPPRPVRAPASPSGQPTPRKSATPSPSREKAQSAGQKPRRSKKQKPLVKYNWFRAILMVIATVAGCFFLALFGIRSASDLFGLEQEDQYYAVTIPARATISQLTDILSDLGVVQEPFTFRLYTGFKYRDMEIKAGEYVLNSNMGYDQIMSLLINGVDKDMEITLTFQEGMTLREIAALLEENEVCEAAAFIEYLQTADLNYDFFNQMPTDGLRYHKLEGYLFPDTYNFYIGERVASVAKKFFDNFNRKITTDMQNRMRNLNLTLDETITLASVIQREAGDPSHMRRVSSVFHNRLDSGQAYPNLQSDVTLLYVESNIKPYLQAQNQAMYDAYNTYVREGLPVGPICNPGLEAIQAALYPAETDYYFFVTDVNMEFYYAVTPSEHYQNIRTAASQDSTGSGSIHGVNTR